MFGRAGLFFKIVEDLGVGLVMLEIIPVVSLSLLDEKWDALLNRIGCSAGETKESFSFSAKCTSALRALKPLKKTWVQLFLRYWLIRHRLVQQHSVDVRSTQTNQSRQE